MTSLRTLQSCEEKINIVKKLLDNMFILTQGV